MKRRLFLLGSPNFYPGANSEILHTLLLWSRFGLKSFSIPVYSMPSGIGNLLLRNKINILMFDANKIYENPIIEDGVVVSFGCIELLKQLEQLKEKKCTTIWVGCMTDLNDSEKEVFKQGLLPDIFVFQSNFQKNRILSQLSKINISIPESRTRLIRGAFIEELFPFQIRPHVHKQRFYIGRAARPTLSKWRVDLFKLLSSVKYPLFCILLGVNKVIRPRLGFQPPWIVCLEPESIPMNIFYSSLHCYFHINNNVHENWPRVGLEAMSCGVPIVARIIEKDGWTELLGESSKNGFICETDNQFISAIEKLALEEDLRIEIANSAKRRLKEVCHPEQVWSSWRVLFGEIGVL